jgi:hypothetical protein
MCFTQELSLAFSIGGIIIAAVSYKFTGNKGVTAGVLYFVLMELLQFFQYFFIATDVDPMNPTPEAMRASPACQRFENQFLNSLGLVHVAFQPYFTHLLSCPFVRKPASVAQVALVQRLCLVCGVFICARHFLALWPEALVPFGIGKFEILYTSSEWLSGIVNCTYKGKTHLAWSTPFVPSSYYLPSMQLHAFMMFTPFFVFDFGKQRLVLWIAGLLLFATGPMLGDYITDNKQEAASIWCFFSICQIGLLMTVLVISAVTRKKKKGKSKRA